MCRQVVEVCSLAALLCACLCLGSTLAQQQQQQVTVLKYEVIPNSGDGSYSFSYELSDGSARSEKGELVNPGTPDEYMLVTGFYRFTTPDNQVIQVDYTADKDGYHPKVQWQGGGGGVSGSLLASLVG